MKATDLIRLSLDQSKGWLNALLADMKAQPTTAPTPRGGNHPLWVLGHLASAEAGMIAGFIHGKENPLAKWDKLFGMGTEPVADAAKYPSWDELMGEFERTRANTLKLLGTYSDADLDRVLSVPDNMKAFFGTVGQVFAMISVHTAFHTGQVADARHAAGKKPVFG